MIDDPAQLFESMAQLAAFASHRLQRDGHVRIHSFHRLIQTFHDLGKPFFFSLFQV